MHRKKTLSLLDALIVVATFGAFLFSVASVLASMTPIPALRFPAHVKIHAERKLEARTFDREVT